MAFSWKTPSNCIPFLPWAAVCLLALAIPFSPSFHPLLSPDSLHYADIARTLAGGEGLATYHLNLGSPAVPDPFLYWPPLFPVLLAGGMKVGLTTDASFRLVILLSLLASALAVYRLGVLFRGKGFGWVCLAAWLVLWPFQKFWFHGWAEIPFTALMALLLAALVPAARRGAPSRRFLLPGILAGLAFLCRYPGLVALPLGGTALYLSARREGISLVSRRSLARAGLFLVPFLLLALPWILRNLSLGGPFGPPRKPALEGALFLQAGSLFKAGLRLLYLPAGLAFLAALFGFGGREEGRTGKARNGDVLLFLGAYLLFYCVLLLVLGGLIRFDRIRSRLAGPMLISILPLALAGGFASSGRFRWKGLFPGRGSVLFLSVLLPAAWAGALALRGFPGGGDKRMLPPRLEAWIEEHTRPGSLVVAPMGWWVPYQTGRPVLESGYPEQEPLTPDGVEAFLGRFQGRFKAVYLLVQESLPEARRLAAEFKRREKIPPPVFEGKGWRIFRLPGISSGKEKARGGKEGKKG